MSHDDVLRAKEDYSSFERALQQQLMQTETVEFNDQIAGLDTLFAQHASTTSNTVIVERDQETFKLLDSGFLRVMTSRARGVAGELTTGMFLAALRNENPRVARQQELETGGLGAGEDAETDADADADGELYEETRRAWAAQRAQLDKLGVLFLRAGRTALRARATPFAPTLAPKPPVRAAPARRTPLTASDAALRAPETGSLNKGLAHTSDQRQLVLQDLVVATVAAHERQQQQQQQQQQHGHARPLSLYRLCFDENLALCIENFFLVCTLVKEQRLIVSESEGLPVVSTPTPGGRGSEHVGGGDVRRQINLSLDQATHACMRGLFPGPMIIRGDNDGSEVGEVGEVGSEGEEETD